MKCAICIKGKINWLKLIRGLHSFSTKTRQTVIRVQNKVIVISDAPVIDEHHSSILISPRVAMTLASQIDDFSSNPNIKSFVWGEYEFRKGS